MNIAIVLTGISEGVFFYRYKPYSYLTRQNKNIHITYFKGLDNAPVREVLKNDVLIVDRPSNPQALSLIKAAKEKGVRVIVEYDDDLLNVQPGNYTYLFFLQSDVRESIIESMRLANMVIVSTQSIAETVMQYNTSVTVVPNCWNDYEHRFNDPRQDPDDKEPYQMTWRGSNTHDRDIYLVKEALNWGLKQPKLQFSFFGFYPHYLERNFQIMPWLKFPEYIKMMYRQSPHFIFCPLEDCKFNQGKSFNIWLEATLFGSILIIPAGFEEFPYHMAMLKYYGGKSDLADIFREIIEGQIPEQDRLKMLTESRRIISNSFRLSSVNELRENILEVVAGKVGA